MKTLSSKKLAERVKTLRESKGYTKEELGNLTNINRIMIGRIEKQDFVPSIIQCWDLILQKCLLRKNKQILLLLLEVKH